MCQLRLKTSEEYDRDQAIREHQGAYVYYNAIIKEDGTLEYRCGKALSVLAGILWLGVAASIIFGKGCCDTTSPDDLSGIGALIGILVLSAVFATLAALSNLSRGKELIRYHKKATKIMAAIKTIKLPVRVVENYSVAVNK